MNDDDTPSWAIKEHVVTEDGFSCKEIQKNASLPSHTETCIEALTTEMFKDKKAKQAHLIDLIKKSKKETERRLQTLTNKKENCCNCSKQNLDGSEAHGS